LNELADFLLDPLRSGVGLRALAETVPLAALCGALGFWVVSHRASYSAESVAHALLPGLVLAVLAGGSPLVGALPAATLAGGLIALAAREEAIGADTATAIVVTTMLGLGALLALEPDVPARLDELLFGDPLAADGGDIALALVLLGAGVLALAASIVVIAK
jgi:ABC-type Mn2+/Zn2+ transport system permease subunit